MCTVYEFPKQFKLSKEMEDRLQSIADEYVETLTGIAGSFMDENTTDEEYEKITEMILTELANNFIKAINNL